MAITPQASHGKAVSCGPFSLIVAERPLLWNNAPAEPGWRSLDFLIAL